MNLVVAGIEVRFPAEALARYAEALAKTVRLYDAPGPGRPDLLTGEEVARTRVIASRISKAEEEWFIKRSSVAPWSDVDPELRLANLDPESNRQQYQAAVNLYDHFRSPRRPGVATAKISKVLHLKRPHLVPILDTQLSALYRAAARRQAKAHRNLQQPPARALFWLAIREDLVRPGVLETLLTVRARLRQHALAEARLLGEVSDVRLLDILAWAKD